MGPAIPRLKKRSEFLRVASARNKWVTKGLILQARMHRGKNGKGKDESAPLDVLPYRIGFTVSKKVGNAVARNRARRRLRAIAELVLKRHAKDGFDFVLIGRGETLVRPFTDLQKDLEYALMRLNAHKSRVPKTTPRDGHGNKEG